jgi:hypothetical protein
VNETTLNELPLVTRNFTQIVGLSPRVTVGIYKAGELALFSSTWALPSAGNEIQRPIFGDWIFASTMTVQLGNPQTIAHTNLQNVFGISEDRAEVTGRCTNSQFVTGGPINSKLGDHFYNPCFTTPPVIGLDGEGNSRTGAATGPDRRMSMLPI